MDLRQIPLLGAISRRMSWLNQRQQVLAQNVANSDTPKYRARDLREEKFADQLSQFKRLRVAQTSPAHKSAAMEGSKFRVEVSRRTYEQSPNENNVVVAEQMLKVADTRIQYETMTTLYKKHVNMVRTALGK